jgi:hypothetical protein
MTYYFGKNWSEDMYKLIEDGERPHSIKSIKQLKEINMGIRKTASIPPA